MSRACSGGLGEEIAPPAERHVHRHDQLLADRIDRRIGDLREELLEIGVEQPRLQREDGQRRVVAHRADRFRAGRGHRLEDHLDLFAGVAEGELALGEPEDIERLRGRGGSALARARSRRDAGSS